MNDLHYVDLSTSHEYKFQDNKEDLMTSTDNSFGTESMSSTSALQQGGFFWGNGCTKNDEKCLIAARTKDYGVVDFMLNNDMLSELAAQDEDGSTLLHYLSRDSSVNSKVSSITASILKRDDISKFINVQDRNGDTPLVSAVKAGNMPLSAKLISNGADPKIKNKDGLYVATETEKDTQTAAHVSSEKELTESINEMVNMFVKMGKPVVIDTESPLIIDTESPFMPDHLSITETAMSQKDATDNASSYSIKDTGSFLNMLEDKYITGDQQKNQQGNSNQEGGVSKIRMGHRTLRYYGNEGSYEGTASDAELSRMIDNQASEIHKRVVEKIMDILKIDEKIARNYKAALYKEIRDEQPALSNLDRAVEMEKRATKDRLEAIDIKKVTKEIEKHLKSREKEREERDKDENSDKKTKKSNKKTKKSNKKTTTKKSKAQSDSEGISETSVGSPNAGILSETSLSDSPFNEDLS